MESQLFETSIFENLMKEEVGIDCNFNSKFTVESHFCKKCLKQALLLQSDNELLQQSLTTLNKQKMELQDQNDQIKVQLQERDAQVKELKRENERFQDLRLESLKQIKELQAAKLKIDLSRVGGLNLPMKTQNDHILNDSTFTSEPDFLNNTQTLNFRDTGNILKLKQQGSSTARGSSKTKFKRLIGFAVGTKKRDQQGSKNRGRDQDTVASLKSELQKKALDFSEKLKDMENKFQEDVNKHELMLAKTKIDNANLKVQMSDMDEMLELSQMKIMTLERQVEKVTQQLATQQQLKTLIQTQITNLNLKYKEVQNYKRISKVM